MVFFAQTRLVLPFFWSVYWTMKIICMRIEKYHLYYYPPLKMELKCLDEVDALLYRRVREWYGKPLSSSLSYSVGVQLAYEFKEWMESQHSQEFQAVSAFDQRDEEFGGDSFGAAIRNFSMEDPINKPNEGQESSDW